MNNHRPRLTATNARKYGLLVLEFNAITLDFTAARDVGVALVRIATPRGAKFPSADHQKNTRIPTVSNMHKLRQNKTF